MSPPRAAATPPCRRPMCRTAPTLTGCAHRLSGSSRAAREAAKTRCFILAGRGLPAARRLYLPAPKRALEGLELASWPQTGERPRRHARGPLLRPPRRHPAAGNPEVCSARLPRVHPAPVHSLCKTPVQGTARLRPDGTGRQAGRCWPPTDPATPSAIPCASTVSGPAAPTLLLPCSAAGMAVTTADTGK